MEKDVSYALNLEKYPESYKKFLKEEQEKLIPLLEKEYSVLDVGCGNGRMISIIAPKVKRYLGIDIDKKVIEEVKEKSKNFNNSEIINLNAEKLTSKFKDNSFDLVVCLWNTVACVKDDKKLFGEIYRVTKKLFFLSAIKKGTLEERKKYYNSLGINYSIDKNESINSDTWGRVKAYSEKEITSLAKDVGFKILEIGDLANLSYYLILEK
ncbi:MAG: class I SAM-dependent methyltransferase [Nanoarchaeota archaeon]